LNGTTIQVIHTDAEGRMVLADTLSLAATRKPRAIIDYATLTGACVYALTERYSGAFTNRPEARELIEAAGSSSGERVWCFPMDEDFDTDLESSVADIVQCADRRQGRSHPGGALLEPLRAQGHPLAASGSRGRHAHGGLAHIGHGDHRLRRALHAGSAAPRLAAPPARAGAPGRAMNTLTLRRPDDWHVHLRDGAALGAVVKFTASASAAPSSCRISSRRSPPTALARAYRERILAALPAAGHSFEPLMTLYLTDATAPEEIDARKPQGFVHGVKLYPAGATTHSDAGVTDIRHTYATLERMQEVGMPLQVHGETPARMWTCSTARPISSMPCCAAARALSRVAGGVRTHHHGARRRVRARGARRRRRDHHAAAPAAQSQCDFSRAASGRITTACRF
jgi:hypothetical protein